MAQRACGYCRDIGHQRPKCPNLHNQRKELVAHVNNETLKIYKYLCSAGLGPNALVNASVLNWGASTSKPPLLAQVLPYDFELTQRYWSGSSYKATFADTLASALYRTKNIKYSKQISIHHLHLEQHSIYANIPILLLDGSNNAKLTGLSMYQFYQAGKPNPDNNYAALEGRELIEKLFINPSYDCPPIELPKNIASPAEEFYPDRIRL